MVTDASAGPNVKSSSLTGGKSESALGAKVGSVEIAAQLVSEVGVSEMIGFSTTLTVDVDGVCVDEIPALGAQALKINIAAVENNRNARFFFIY